MLFLYNRRLDKVSIRGETRSFLKTVGNKVRNNDEAPKEMRWVFNKLLENITINLDKFVLTNLS